MSKRQLHIIGDSGLDVGLFVTLREALERIHPASPRRLGLVFSAQVSEGQRRIGQQSDLFAEDDLRQTGFEGPVDQVVGVLDRHHARQAVFPGQAEKLHHTPGRFVGNADMADLARGYLFSQDFKLRAYRHIGLFLGRVELVLPEHRHIALRPMQLVEVDVIRFQASQRTLQCGLDIVAIEYPRAVAQPSHGPARPGHLGRQDHLVARLPGEPAANDGLRHEAGLGARRYRVHLRRIDEVDAAFEGVVELRMCLGLGVLLAEGHGAQAHRRNHQIAAAELPILHVVPARFRMQDNAASIPFGRRIMKTLPSLIILISLTACGAEVVGTAAVQAEARKQEIEAAKQIEAQYRQQTEQAMRQGMQRLQEAEGKSP